MTLETVQGNLLLKQDRNKHQYRRLLLQRLRYHITSVEWIDVEPGQYDKSCIEVSKKMISLLRHDPSVLPEEDKAVEFSILTPMFRSELTSSQHRSIRTWLNYLLKGRRDCSIVWMHTLLIPSFNFEQFKAILKVHISILHCKTTYCHRMTSPSTSTTLEAPTIRTRSFNRNWFRVAKTSRKRDMRCSLRPWTQCSSIIFVKGITTWRSPGLQCTNTIGKYTKIQCIGVIWGLLRVKDCSSIKRDQTRSSFRTLYLRFAARRWRSGSQEKNCTAQRVSLQLHRKKLCWSRPCIVNARTLQAPTRERPSTLPASTKKIVTVERTKKVVAVK